MWLFWYGNLDEQKFYWNLEVIEETLGVQKFQTSFIVICFGCGCWTILEYVEFESQIFERFGGILFTGLSLR